MSDKEIVIPEGMLDAALKAANYSELWFKSKVRDAVREALRWLSEHPIVPTSEQMLRLYDDLSQINDGELTKRGVVEWQRRMFLSPEPEVEPLTMYIMRHFDDVELDKQTLRNRAEAAVSDFREHENRNVPEPEVPEAIKDLMWQLGNSSIATQANKDILEAYRRGLAKR